MRILHVNLSDAKGGAAIACARLHQGLLSAGVDSHLLVYAVVDRGDPRVHALTTGMRHQLQRVLLKVSGCLTQLQKDPTLFSFSANFFDSPLLNRINAINPDIVHLHWVGADILPLSALAKIKQPIVWTHHDMWPFSGGEHYNYGERWRDGYTGSTRPDSAIGVDWARFVWRRRYRAWRDVPVAHVGPSTWMTECASESKLWKGSLGSTFTTIPNGLDLDLFYPQERMVCRREFQLNEELPLLLFGAHSQNSSIKGGDLLYHALDRLRLSGRSFQIATFGGGGFIAPEGIVYTNLGTINDNKQLAKLYSAADVMLVPSRLEAFGQTASEAQACGTPVACFDTSGLRDIVNHKIDGYKACAFELDDFVDGIIWCLDRAPLQMSGTVASDNPFELNTCTRQYSELYQSILAQ